MCFDISLNHPIELVAEEDIICFKTTRLSDRMFNGLGMSQTLNDKFISAYYGKRYEIGIKQEPQPLISEDNRTHIEYGYHSFNKLGLNVRNGLFGLFSQKAEFIIPKGTKYYMNRFEYVSETIIMKGWID